MKKALLSGLLGFATVASSFGQGYIEFDNYASTPYMPVVYGLYSDGPAGTGVTSASYHVDLLYYIGTTSSTFGMTDAGLSVPINPSLMDKFGNHGYFEGGIYTVPGYVSGPVSFAIESWQTTYGGGTFATAAYQGISAVWQESSLATGLQAVNFFAGMPGPNGAPLLSVGGVPEPSLLALSGVAAAAFMLRRRPASKS